MVQGLIYKVLKRNGAKKEKRLNCKNFPKAGEYFCEYQQKQGVFCKISRAGCV
jgi:hypothetical protein